MDMMINSMIKVDYMLMATATAADCALMVKDCKQVVFVKNHYFDNFTSTTVTVTATTENKDFKAARIIIITTTSDCEIDFIIVAIDIDFRFHHTETYFMLNSSDLAIKISTADKLLPHSYSCYLSLQTIRHLPPNLTFSFLLQVAQMDFLFAGFLHS